MIIHRLRSVEKSIIILRYFYLDYLFKSMRYVFLQERNYRVWMDFEQTYDDILPRMAKAIENSYIVLLCINREYSESDYCRLGK